MTIAIVKHSTKNIGDDIQRVALERLLPSVDVRVDREDTETVNSFGKDVKFIANGWFSQRQNTYLTNAQCLCIGFHSDDVAWKPSIIGCRDLHTLNVCQRRNIPAWLSWCVTLTLEARPPASRKGVVFVDVAGEDEQRIPEEIVKNADRIVGHHIDSSMPLEERTKRAEELLEIYQRAELVVTCRLHAALPCVAFGTPVVFTKATFEPYRWSGYENMVWNLDNCPWSFRAYDSENPWINIAPRVSPEYALGLSSAFRAAVAQFVRS